MVYQSEHSFSTPARCCWVDVTGAVQTIVTQSAMSSGICLVCSLHTTAAITINENADPDVGRDFFLALERMVPVDAGYRHSEGNSDSHVKASLVGLSVQVPVVRNRLVLGTWQSIYFCEFDGPRSRRISVMLLGG